MPYELRQTHSPSPSYRSPDSSRSRSPQVYRAARNIRRSHNGGFWRYMNSLNPDDVSDSHWPTVPDSTDVAVKGYMEEDLSYAWSDRLEEEIRQAWRWTEETMEAMTELKTWLDELYEESWAESDTLKMSPETYETLIRVVEESTATELIKWLQEQTIKERLAEGLVEPNDTIKAFVTSQLTSAGLAEQVSSIPGLSGFVAAYTDEPNDPSTQA